MALACDPKLLILDEPTTGLDATVEAEVLELVRNLRTEYGTSVLFISHNLGAIRSMCERVGVLYAGKVVEEGPAGEVFDDPSHPYTVGLLRCLPRHGSRKAHQRLETIAGFLPQVGAELPTCVFVDRCPLADQVCHDVAPEWSPVGDRMVRCHHVDQVPAMAHAAMVQGTGEPAVDRTVAPILELKGVSKTFHQAGKDIHALNDVSIALYAGETVGLVGESGSGKTTLAHTVLGIHAPDQPDTLLCDGKSLPPGTRRARRRPGARNPDRVSESRFCAQPASLRTPHRDAHAPPAGQGARRSGGGTAARDDGRGAAHRSTPRYAPRAAVGRARSSASPSPVPSPANRASWCATSRRPRSMCPCRQRS